MLRNKRQCLFVLSLALALTLTTLLLTFYSNLFWNRWDYQILDHVYFRSVNEQKNAKLSPKIKFISITDRDLPQLVVPLFKLVFPPSRAV